MAEERPAVLPPTLPALRERGGARYSIKRRAFGTTAPVVLPGAGLGAVGQPLTMTSIALSGSSTIGGG